MFLAVWSLRMFCAMFWLMAALIIPLPDARGQLLNIVLIASLITVPIELVIYGLEQLKEWAWWSALLICVFLIYVGEGVFFGLPGLLGVMAARSKFDAVGGRSFNARTYRRPAGVIVIAAVQFLLGVQSVLDITFINLLGLQLVAPGNPSEFLPVRHFMLVIGILSLCMGCGMYFLQRWALFGTLITQSIAVFGFIYFIYIGEGMLFFRLCFSLITVGYLLSSDVWKASMRYW